MTYLFSYIKKLFFVICRTLLRENFVSLQICLHKPHCIHSRLHTFPITHKAIAYNHYCVHVTLYTQLYCAHTHTIVFHTAHCTHVRVAYINLKLFTRSAVPHWLNKVHPISPATKPGL